MPRKIKINDTTLRDGIQQPGVYLSSAQKIKIFKALIICGVDDVEIGTLHNLETDLYKIAKKNKEITSLWCRGTHEDALGAIETGFFKIHFAFPVSDIHLKTFGFTKKFVLSQIKTIVRMSQTKIPFVSIGAMDATRCDIKFLIKIAQLLQYLGVKKFRIADTVGTSTPLGIAALIKKVRDVFNGELEFHGHNDFGMAVANSITAAQNGADSIGVTVNGLGERCGNADMASTVAALKFTDNALDCGVNLKMMKKLSNLVVKESGVAISPTAPVVGSSIFTHESGIHVNELLKNPLAFQPFCPEEIEAPPTTFVLGINSGSASVQYTLAKNNVFVTRDIARSLLRFVKQNAKRNNGILTEASLLKIWQKQKDTFSLSKS